MVESARDYREKYKRSKGVMLMRGRENLVEEERSTG